MIDPTIEEKLAIQDAVQFASEYIAELDKRNLEDFTYDEVVGLCEAIINGYLQAMKLN